LRTLVRSARQRLATSANATYTLLCWQLGRRLLRDNLQGGRAAYGKQILATVSQELTAEFGAGFNYTSLTRMARFAEWMTNEQILATLSQTLSWSHFVELLPIKDPLARDFYAETCRIERWDVRTLRRKIGGMLYQRTALSKQPDAGIGAEIGQLRGGQMSGLILCASADAEQVELLQLDAKSIRVSEYLTELPPLPLLRARLHSAIEHARESAARQPRRGAAVTQDFDVALDPLAPLIRKLSQIQRQAAQQEGHLPVGGALLRLHRRAGAAHSERVCGCRMRVFSPRRG
jgi:hypothetical protein